MRRTCASVASVAAMATRCLHARVVAAMEQGRATWLVRYAIAATSRGDGVRRAGGVWGVARVASRARHRRGDPRGDSRRDLASDAAYTRLHVHVLENISSGSHIPLALLERGQHARELRALGLAVHLSICYVTQRF